MNRLAARSVSLLRRVLRVGRWFLVALVLLLLPFNAAVEYTAQPKFCNSCHIMEPYYDSWEAGTHKNVTCVECHYAPGIRETVWTKFQALSQVVSYVTATAATRPFARVEDASCLRSGCHSTESLREPKPFGGIRFDHRPHLEASSPGRQLRCTTCHTQTTRDQHMAVETSTCFLCHFKDRPPGEALGGCTACHALPAKIVTDRGLEFDHATVGQRGMACVDCHRGVTGHGGEVTREHCLTCHSDPVDLAAFDRAFADKAEGDRLHASHIAGANVDCRSCHTRIVHGSRRPAPTADVACRSCHGGGHRAETEFVAGRADDAALAPQGLMGRVGISCHACHRGHDEAAAKAPATCAPCHGPEAGRMLADWKGFFLDAEAAIIAQKEQAAALLGSGVSPESQSALERAERNVARVRAGKGVHNIGLGQKLLREAHGDIQTALRAAGRTEALEVPAALAVADRAGACGECHVKAESRSGRFGELEFQHGPHLRIANLRCTDCHAEGRPHGRVSIDRKQCADCHHDREDGDCQVCHRPQAGFYLGVASDGVTPPAPDVMASKVPCIACHVDRGAKGPAAVRPTCIECHDDAYGAKLDEWVAEGSSLLAHLEGPLDRARRGVFEADRSLPAFPEARRLLDEAEATVTWLRRARSAHNPVGARALAVRVADTASRILELLDSR